MYLKGPNHLQLKPLFLPKMFTRKLSFLTQSHELPPHQRRGKFDSPPKLPPSPIQVLDTETYRMSNVHLKNVCVQITLVTFFEQEVFGKPKVLLDIYHHFENELDRDCIQMNLKDEALTH